MDLDATQKTALLTDLDKEQQAYSKKPRKPKDPEPLFQDDEGAYLAGLFHLRR